MWPMTLSLTAIGRPAFSKSAATAATRSDRVAVELADGGLADVGMEHAAGGEARGAVVGAAADDALAAERGGERLDVADAVLQRQREAVAGRTFCQRRRGGLGGVAVDQHDRQVDRADRGRVGRRRQGHADLAGGGGDHQAAGDDRRDMGRVDVVEHDLGAGTGEARAEARSHRAGTDHGYAHDAGSCVVGDVRAPGRAGVSARHSGMSGRALRRSAQRTRNGGRGRPPSQEALVDLVELAGIDHRLDPVRHLEPGLAPWHRGRPRRP